MNVIDSLFITTDTGVGSHAPMTLPKYASQYLADIESWLGPRDPSFALVGIDIDMTPGNPPRLWFPDSGIPPDDAEQRSRHVIIHLGPSALTDSVRARWQLAHECVHLLDPWNLRVDGRPTNLLEEGLATWYQNSRVPEGEWHEEPYAEAEELVRPLVEELPEAVRHIRQELALRIGEITPDILQDHCPGISDQTLWRLCQPFGNQAEAAKQDAAIEANPRGLGFGTGD